MNCPICELAGLEENRQQCPQCESDLRPFFLLQALDEQERIEKEQLKQQAEKREQAALRQGRTPILIAWGASFLALAVLLYFIWPKKTVAPMAKQEGPSKEEMLALQKQVKQLRTEGDSLRQALAQQPKSAYVYTVKAGDSPIRLARFFYGRDEEYKRLLEANELALDAMLKVGQKLTIPAL